MLREDNVEDFALCGNVTGQLRRVIETVAFGPDGAQVQLLRVYEVPAG
jgi:hypothetical protein